ncbi:glycosyltransferase family 39 protein [Thermodesulfobacteriota bacterium]
MLQKPISETYSQITPNHHSMFWKYRLLFPFLFLVLALLVRLPGFTESLWYDEVCYTLINLSSNSIKEMLFQDVHPFLYPLFMRGWIELFGDSEISVRLPSLLFGLTSLGVTFFLARNWFNTHIAFLATLLMALSPVHIWYSQENKTNMLLLLLTVLAFYWLQRAWADNRWQHWLLFMVTAILALWTNHFALWGISSAFLWIWLRMLWEQGHTRLKWAVISSTLVALAYLPVVLLTLFQINSLGRSYLRPFTISETYKLFLTYLSHGNTLRTISPYAPFGEFVNQPWGFFLIEGFFIFLLGSSLVVIGRQWLMHRKKPFASPFLIKPGSELLLFYLLIPPISLLLASRIYPQIYIERSMIILLPPFMILLACGVISFTHTRWCYIILGALLLLNSWSLFNLWGPKSETWTVYKHNADWRSVAAYFDNEITKSTGKFLIINGRYTPATALTYYYSRLGKSKAKEKIRSYPPHLPIIHVREYGKLIFSNFLSQNNIKAFYLIYNRSQQEKVNSLLKNLRENYRFQLLSQTSFGNIKISKFHFLP